MLKKTIKYVDYNGTDREEDFYFNINKAELAKLNLSTEGGLEARLDKISKAKDIPEMVKLFDQVIEISFGKKSDDGRRLIKGKDVYEEFKQTEAYSEFFMELMDPDYASKFIRAIIPQDLSDKLPSDQELGIKSGTEIKALN